MELALLAAPQTALFLKRSPKLHQHRANTPQSSSHHSSTPTIDKVSYSRFCVATQLQMTQSPVILSYIKARLMKMRRTPLMDVIKYIWRTPSRSHAKPRTRTCRMRSLQPVFHSSLTMPLIRRASLVIPRQPHDFEAQVLARDKCIVPFAPGEGLFNEYAPDVGQID